jgi:flagellar motor switch protein FliM
MSSDLPATPPPPEAAPSPAPPAQWTNVMTAQGRMERRQQTAIQPFDCGHSSVLTPGELRRIRQRQEHFVRALAGRLSIHLRTEFAMKISRLTTVSYQRLVDGLRAPTHLALFKADPLKGVCLLEVPPRLVLLIVDRLLGGPGQAPASPGELTDIEVAIFDQAVHIILAEWCAQWKDLQEIRAVPLGHENNARFLQTAPGDTPMLVLSVETTIGNFSEQLQIALAVSILDPLLRKLAATTTAEKEAVPVPPARPRWNRQLNDVQVPVTAEWRGLQLTARELAGLKTGDVLDLTAACASQVQLRLAQRPKFTGRLGTRGSHWAVQVNGPVQP